MFKWREIKFIIVIFSTSFNHSNDFDWINCFKCLKNKKKKKINSKKNKNTHTNIPTNTYKHTYKHLHKDNSKQREEKKIIIIIKNSKIKKSFNYKKKISIFFSSLLDILSLIGNFFPKSSILINGNQSIFLKENSKSFEIVRFGIRFSEFFHSIRLQ